MYGSYAPEAMSRVVIPPFLAVVCVRFQSSSTIPRSPTTPSTLRMSPSASANGTSGLPVTSENCHGVQTLMKVGVLPANSFSIESRIRTANGRVSPQIRSFVSKSRKVSPKCACPSGGGTRRIRAVDREPGAPAAAAFASSTTKHSTPTEASPRRTFRSYASYLRKTRASKPRAPWRPTIACGCRKLDFGATQHNHRVHLVGTINLSVIRPDPSGGRSGAVSAEGLSSACKFGLISGRDGVLAPHTVRGGSSGKLALRAAGRLADGGDARVLGRDRQ